MFNGLSDTYVFRRQITLVHKQIIVYMQLEKCDYNCTSPSFRISYVENINSLSVGLTAHSIICLSKLCVKACPGDKSRNFNSEPLGSEMEDNTKNLGTATDVDGWIKWGIIIFGLR